MSKVGQALSARFGSDASALVTGGGGGVGRAVAQSLRAHGVTPLLMGRREAPLAAASEALGGVPIACGDVADRASVQTALDALAAQAPAPRIVIHTAGIAESGPTLPPDDARWARQLAVNATGTWHVATATLPAMIAAGGGAFLAIASTAALRGYAYTAAYVASKHAALGLVRALAEDYGRKGLQTGAICPGFLDTPMTDRSIENLMKTAGMDEAAARNALASMNASGRLIRPEEVAEACLDLLCDPTRQGEAIVLE